MSKFLSNIEQATMGHPSQRSGRLFFLAAFAFCGAALVTGFCFVYAVQAGLERLAFYHPFASEQTNLRSLHPLFRLTRLELSSDEPVIVSRPMTGLGRDQGTSGAEDAYSAFDVTGYKVGKPLPKGRPALPWQRGQQANSTMPVVPLSSEDFVAAIVTDEGHEKLAQTGRAWRQGIRTFIATNYNLTEGNQTANAVHNETYAYYPDDEPLHSLALKGDSRAALVPFLAHEHYGDSYKWLLYGDDDTFFFLDAAMNVLQHLDPDIPYFLTGMLPTLPLFYTYHMWWTSKGWDAIGNHGYSDTHHPNLAAPLCAPCNYAKNTSALPFPQPNGCPCTPELLCAADHKGVLFKGARGKCGMPRTPTHTFSMHGGAGAILSIGLMRQIPRAWFEDCVTTTYTTGGDAMISICLWEAGFGMTAPDPQWHPRDMSMFDVGRWQQLDHEDIEPRIAHVMGNMLQAIAGGCQSGFCKLELEHFLTLHLRSRKFPSTAAYMETVRVLGRLVDQMRSGSAPPTSLKGSKTDQILELGIRTVGNLRWLVPSRSEGRNNTSAELESMEETMQQAAEHRAAYAVALEIVNSIFNRNAPKSEPVKEESSNSATDTEAQAAAAEKEAKKLEKDAKARMQAHADSVLEDILDE